MSKTGKSERPVSPHLQVYRWKLHMTLSILHRATGVVLGLGALIVAWWLVAIASGPAAYAGFRAAMGHPLGQVILFGFTYALMLHLLNGIRHLFWDAGIGFKLENVRKSGLAVVILSILLALGIWAAGYWLAGTV